MGKDYKIGDEVRLTETAFEILKESDNGLRLLEFNSPKTVCKIIVITQLEAEKMFSNFEMLSNQITQNDLVFLKNIEKETNLDFQNELKVASTSYRKLKMS